MIDTHCHLTDPRIFVQLEAVLARAAAAGVEKMVTIGTQPDDWHAVIKLAEKNPRIRCAIGVHPNHCHEVPFEHIAALADLQTNPVIVAIGEMGLDYHHAFAPKPLQAKFFEAQLQIADKFARPVIIHCREAVDDCLAILKSFPKIRAVLHCFTGTAEEARRIVDAGYLLGFTGVVTFKNAASLRSIAAEIPPDRILVETDAPYLSPEPMRGQKTNEPALVIHTAAAVAAARSMSVADLDALTTANALRFYQWKV